MGLASREGRSCRQGLCCSASLRAEENRIKLPQVTVCLQSLLRAPSCGIWGREGTWQRMSLSRTRRNILHWVRFPGQTCSPALGCVCVQLPEMELCCGRAAFGQPRHPRGSQFSRGVCCPFAGALHRLQDACGCDFASRMPGRASLPPLHGQTSLIPVAAEAGGRLQEVWHPSLCHLVL